MPQLLTQAADFRAFCDGVRRQDRRLALVPTMGYLHEGHLSLMHEGRARADAVAVTLFVNPAQFGPREDLSRYPRDLEGDLAKCASAQVEVVYAPSVEEVYPPGFQTYVEVEQASRGLCGGGRPGHFRGVATVVTKLLALARPDVALFGEKDYQQLQVIRALNQDLDLGAEIVGLPTIREEDGLAMSSRNAYLTAAERRRALAIHRGLQAASALRSGGERSADRLLEAVRAKLRDAEIKEEYVALVDAHSLTPLQSAPAAGGEGRLLVAAWVGTTRLIDNVAI